MLLERDEAGTKGSSPTDTLKPRSPACEPFTRMCDPSTSEWGVLSPSRTQV